MKKPHLTLVCTVVIGFVIALIACGKSIDPNASTSHCVPECTGTTMCQVAYQATGIQCAGEAPVDCGSFDASVTHCPPCIVGASCEDVPECSPDDCNCVLAHRCPSVQGGQCIQTSSGHFDYFCFPG